MSNYFIYRLYIYFCLLLISLGSCCSCECGRTVQYNACILHSTVHHLLPFVRINTARATAINKVVRRKTTAKAIAL